MMHRLLSVISIAARVLAIGLAYAMDPAQIDSPLKLTATSSGTSSTQETPPMHR